MNTNSLEIEMENINQILLQWQNPSGKEKVDGIIKNILIFALQNINNFSLTWQNKSILCKCSPVILVHTPIVKYQVNENSFYNYGYRDNKT